MPLHPEILDGTPTEGARGLALGMLAEARGRASLLAGPADAEALHDFRVSIRRLRSTLRAWREPLGKPVRDKDLRRLRRVARATSAARDAEVMVAWVAGIAGSLPPAHRATADWLAARLDSGTQRADLSRSLERFGAAADSLTRRFGRETPAGSPGALAGTSAGTFAAALAGRIREQASSVQACLSRVKTEDDAPLAHRARIEGKRLRYLIEPLREAIGARADPAVKALKRLQDLLGDLNDAQLAATATREARQELGAEPARAGQGSRLVGLRPGLRALERLADERAHQLFSRILAEVLPTHGAALLEPALGVAAALEARAHSS